MKPILFNTKMVCRILDGYKTVTRRVAFPMNDLREFPRMDYPNGWWFRGRAYTTWDSAMREPQGVMSLCKYRPKDIMYVRETWTQDGDVFRYKAGFYDQNRNWKPSIHMPRKAARIFLRVMDVRLERLQDIDESGAKAEGAIDNRGFIHSPENEYDVIHSAREQFAEIWDSTIKIDDRARYGWDANPWAWVIKFERISKEEAMKEYKFL